MEREILRAKLKQLTGVDGDENALIQFVLDFRDGLVEVETYKADVIKQREDEKEALLAVVAALDAELMALKK